MFERIAYSRGVHLRGSSLWFDAERKRELCLLTGLYGRLPPVHRRAVSSPELADALARVGYKSEVLPAPWDRWIGLGSSQVKLVSADAKPGAAYAVVARGKEIVVAAGLLRRHMVTWPRSDRLVAVVPALGHRGGNREQLVSGLEMFVSQVESDAVRGAVLVDTVEVGLQVHADLAGRGRLLRPTGVFGKLVEEPDLPRTRVALALAGSRQAPATRVAWVDTGVGTWIGSKLTQQPAATFRLRYYADWSTVRHAVSMTGARHVDLVVGATGQTAQHDLGTSINVRLLGGHEQLELVSA